MSIDLNSIIVECQEQRIQGFNDYIAVDQEAGTRFLSTKKQGDFKGGVVLRIVEQKLNFSEPLRRAMSHTTSAAGTKTWREHGMNILALPPRDRHQPLGAHRSVEGCA